MRIFAKSDLDRRTALFTKRRNHLKIKGLRVRLSGLEPETNGLKGPVQPFSYLISRCEITHLSLIATMTSGKGKFVRFNEVRSVKWPETSHFVTIVMLTPRGQA